jgi:CheY-like chemotaxis protein
MQRSILLVEDHPGNRDYALRVLAALGFRALVATTAVEAVRLARSHHPDVILLDIMLAEGDGRAAARALKAAVETADIPILAVTALALDGDRDACIASGCDDYLAKPFTPAQLGEKIARLLAA